MAEDIEFREYYATDAEFRLEQSLHREALCDPFDCPWCAADEIDQDLDSGEIDYDDLRDMGDR